MSPFVRTIAPIGVCRGARGQSAGVALICARMSGDALTSAKRSPFDVTASESCVRARSPSCPARTPTQFGHPQFHCGKPPPAAEPITIARIG